MRSLLPRLVRLFPREFRRQFGEDLVAQIRADYARASARGRLRAFAIGLSIGLDLVVSAVAERLNPTRVGPRTPSTERKESRWPMDGLLKDVRHAVGTLMHDIRFAARSFRRGPGSATVAVAILAVGIGASVTIHDASRSLATDAVPFPEPDRLVTLDMRGERGQPLRPSYTDFLAWETRAAPLLALAAYTLENAFIADGTRTFRAPVARVSGGFFSALEVEPLLGRMLSSADAEPGSDAAAVITQRLWEARFGADPDVFGQTIRIDGRAHVIVGIVPAGLQYPPHVDVWTPLASLGNDAMSLPVNAIGRLRADATAEEAQTALMTIQRNLDRGRPAEERAARVDVVTLSGRPQGSDRIALFLLRGAVLVLLLITATNAGGLLLTRALERGQEIAIRTSLGASRGRIVRQMLAEGVLLTTAAGVLGLAVALFGLQMLRDGLPADMTRHMLGWERLGLDGHDVGFAFVLAAATGLVLGIVPALRALRGDVTVHLREGTPNVTPGRRASRVARLLLSGEVALALTLLITAGLLTRSQLQLQSADPGFDVDGVLTVEWALPPERYEGDEATARLQQQVVQRLGALPGVRSAALASNLPMSRTGWSRSYHVRGSGPAPASEAASASWRPITPEYLRTLGIALLRGRQFVAADGASAPRVAIISEALAGRHWPDGADPIGQQLEVEGEVWTIVGIAHDVHYFGAQNRPTATIYVPQAQSPTRAGFLALRFASSHATLAPRVRDEIWRLDPAIAVGEIQTLPRMVDDFYADERIIVLLMAAFAAIALLITLASEYALVAHSVARRRREIGIRITLGARPSQILAGAMRQGLVWVALGAAAGLLLATGTARLLIALLYGVGPLDSLVFILVPAGFLAVALLASYLAASGAGKVDPVETLRSG